MDLTEYERVKFELAEILRAAAVLVREERPDGPAPFSDLFARLAEDRFNLVVVGRFSRGKSSLMNAMLDTERLPMGIVPLTSVITTVSYGSNERAFIEHEGWNLVQEIALDKLRDYVTQEGNPGNQRRVTVARVELPSELLRRGFHFVDTPGLGSSIIENTRTTERFLPEADAFMLVTSYDSPLSEEELRVLQGVASSVSRIFIAINKHDTVSLEERNEVLDHVRDQARHVFGEPLPQIFSVSAREAIEASKLHDRERFSASGVLDFKEELTRFLLNEKQAQFLVRMSERIADVLHDVPNAQGEAERLRLLHREINQRGPNAAPLAELAAADGAPRFSSCSICARLSRGIYDFLCGYQYDVSIRRDMQARLAEAGGLCSFHTWQYEAIASPQGTCIGFPGLLERLAVRLREIAATSSRDQYALEIEKLRPTPETCDVCRVSNDIEQAAVANAARSFTDGERREKEGLSGLCLPHLKLVVEAIGVDGATKDLLLNEAAVLERVSEDMRRYALKRDGIRRFLASAEEVNAAQRALMLLAGHRNVSGGLRKPS